MTHYHPLSLADVMWGGFLKSILLRTATTSPPQPTDTMKERAKEGDEGRVQDADGLNDNSPLFRL